MHARWFDPYNQNPLKGDRPIKGTNDWFFTLSGVSDSVLEPRSFPTPVPPQTSAGPGSLDSIGRSNSLFATETALVGMAFTKGSTAFKPPEIEVRVSLAFNYNYAEAS